MLSQWFINDLYKASTSQVYELNVKTYKLLKFLFLPISQVLLAVISYYIFKKIGVYRLIQWMLTASAMIVAAFTIGYSMKVTLPQMVPVLLFGSGTIKEVFYNWDISALFLFSHLWPTMTLILFYGYANERFSFSMAGKYYPIFGACAILLSQMFLPPIYDWIFDLNTDNRLLYIGSIICVLILIPKWCFHYLHKTEEEEPKESTAKPLGWRYVFVLGMLAVTVGVVLNISVITSDFSIRLQDRFPGQYWRLLESYTHFSKISTVLALMTMIFLSSYMQKYLSRGWKHFSYAGTVFSVSAGLFVLILHLFSECFYPFFTHVPDHSMIKTITNVSGGYQILISNVIYPLLICLKELAVVPVSSDKRFPALLLIDLIFWKVGYFIVVLFQEMLWALHGIAPPILIFMTLALVVTLSIRLMLIGVIGKRIEHAV